MAITCVSPIDGHVHLRWDEYKNVQPSFAQRAFEDAREVGLCALVEEPNTEPFLKDRFSVYRRIDEVDRIKGNIFHGIAVAITPNYDQREEALQLVLENNRTVSGKTFLAKSTRSGGIEISDEADQMSAWRHVVERFPKGFVWEFHCEDESLFNESYDSTNPVTHSIRQCSEAEVVQAERQFRFAYDFGFEGNIVIKHTSNPDTIDVLNGSIKRYNPEFRVFYEATPHHLLLNWEDYEIHGNRVKMNPPLRKRAMQEKLLDYALRGEIHLIGTDHAPHPIEHKDGGSYKSGIPGILIWPKVIEILRKSGIKEHELKRATFDNANELYFEGRLKPNVVQAEYNPFRWVERYGFNPFSRIDGSFS